MFQNLRESLHLVYISAILWVAPPSISPTTLKFRHKYNIFQNSSQNFEYIYSL